MKKACWVWILLLVVSSFSLVGCDSGDDGEEGAEESSEESESPEGATAGDAEEVEALRAAFEADTNCQILVACCASPEGQSYEGFGGVGLDVVCEQVTAMQDFQNQVDNMTDAAWQSTSCRNRVAGIAGMGTASNPLPEVCQAPE